MARIISGIVMAATLLALILFGTPLMFFIFVELLIAVCAWEMFCMFSAGSQSGLKLTGIAMAMSLGCVIYMGDSTTILVAMMLISLFVPATSVLCGEKDIYQASSNTMFTIIYVAVALITLALIRRGVDGESYIIMIIAANALCDTFAYYTGRSIGKTPLAPSISPGKTVEGFIGGAIGATLSAVAMAYLLLPAIPLIHALSIGLICGFIGPVGDLFESSIKRKMGVKDSGNIIPGHGGFLDRVDSLMFTSPALFIYMTAFMAV